MGICCIKEFFHFCNVKKEYIKYLNLLRRISAMLAFAFILQIANNALFFHTHTTASGKTFHHAHPNAGNHSHNDYQYSFYEHLQLITNFDAPQLLRECSFLLALKQETFDFISKQPHYLNNLLGRAPPIC